MHSVLSKVSFNALKKPHALFCLAWMAILFVPLAPLVPRVTTAMLPWRAEITAAIVLFPFIIRQIRKSETLACKQFSFAEISLVFLPLLGFITWSAASTFWADFPLAAVHHTLIWIEYLLFYLLARQIITKTEDLRLIFYALMPFIWILCLPAIIQYYGYVSFGGSADNARLLYVRYAEIVTALFPLLAVFTLRLKGIPFRLGLLTLLVICLFDISVLGRAILALFVFGLVILALMIFASRQFIAYRRSMLKVLIVLVFVPAILQLVPFIYTQQIPLVERIGNQSIEESNGARPFFFGVAREMFAAHPLRGVGANNFGYEFDDYRAIYSDKNPDAPYLNIAENESPERAHNEFAQIAAELGFVGLVFIAVLIGSAVYLSFIAFRRRKFSLYGNAALLGIVLFMLSSLTSSYSFRLVQNGTVFFFLLAIAFFALKPERSSNKTYLSSDAKKFLRPIYGIGAVACAAMVIFCTMRVLSVVYVERAKAETGDDAAKLYETAFQLDGENSNAYFSYAMKLMEQKRYSASIPFLHRAIESGHARVTDYSLLATAQTLAGDDAGATETFKQAVRRYPLSVFARTRYAILLKNTGEIAASDEQFAAACRIKASDARTWRNLIERGARFATETAFADSSNAQIMDLQPELAIHAVVFEREIVHPEEIFVIPAAAE